MSTARQVAGARRSKKYKALRSEPVYLDDVTALAILGFAAQAVPEPAPQPQVDPRVARLVESGGYTLEEATAVIEELFPTAAATAEPEASEPAEAEAPVEEPEVSGGDVEATPPQPAHDALVEEHGLTFTKGRVYVTPDATEAIVRVRKTGSPEIIQSSGVGRTKALVLFRTDSGDVAIQNLTKAA